MTVQILHREIEEANSDCDSRDTEARRNTLVALAAVQPPATEPAAAKKVIGRAIVNLDHRVVARDRAAVRGGKRVEDGIDQRRLLRVASNRKGPEL